MTNTSTPNHTLRATLVALIVLALVLLGTFTHPATASAAPAAPVTTVAPDVQPLPDNPDHWENYRQAGDCDARGLVRAEDYSCVQPTIPVRYGEVSAAMWEDLYDQGFRATDPDGETFEVPQDVARQACRTDSDCAPTTPAGMTVTYGAPVVELAPDANPYDAPVVAISAPSDVDHPGTALLLAAGYHGVHDGLSAIYAPVNLVLFDETGTWTVTTDGLARCEHGTASPCTGTEWVR